MAETYVILSFTQKVSSWHLNVSILYKMLAFAGSILQIIADLATERLFSLSSDTMRKESNIGVTLRGDFHCLLKTIWKSNINVAAKCNPQFDRVEIHEWPLKKCRIIFFFSGKIRIVIQVKFSNFFFCWIQAAFSLVDVHLQYKLRWSKHSFRTSYRANVNSLSIKKKT